MEDRRFDELTRVLSEGQSGRRRLVKGVLGGGLAAVLGRLGMGSADAQEVGVAAGQRCRTNRQCNRNERCCANGRCLNILNDPRACGRCGVRCAAGETCVNGACIRPCRTGRPGVCDADDCGTLCGCNTLFDRGSGASYCLSVRGSCDNAIACRTHSDCRRGNVCVNDGCCAGKPRVCAPACDSSTAAASTSTAGPSRASGQ